MLSALATGIGYIISWLGTKTGRIIASIVLIVALFTLIPYKIEIPKEIYDVIISSSVTNIFKTINFMFPVKFCLSCIFIILIARYSNIFFKIINWIYSKIIGGGN